MADTVFENRNDTVASSPVIYRTRIATTAPIESSSEDSNKFDGVTCFPRVQPTSCTPGTTVRVSGTRSPTVPTHCELIIAVRQHAFELFRRSPALTGTVVVADAQGRIIDVIGSPDVVSRLDDLHLSNHSHLIFAPQTNPNAAQPLMTSAVSTSVQVGDVALSSTSCPVIDKSRRMHGSIAFVRLGSDPNPLAAPLVQSAAVAAAHYIELSTHARDTLRVHQSLLSHLDYHVIRVNADNTVESQHPIPLPEHIRAKIIQYAKEAADGDAEFFLEDKLYSCNLRQLSDPLSGDVCRLAVFRDVTNQRQMELRVRDADKLSILASLAAGIAHEIRNPLTTAKGFLQLFAERQLENPDRRFLDLTIHELDRIQNLVKDFMSLARPVQPKHENVDLNHLIHEVVHFMYPEALLNNVTLHSEVPNEGAIIFADTDQVRQVLLNVLQNAVQACPHNGQVFIHTYTVSMSIIVSIRDNGCGLSPEQQAKAFQPFFTTKPTGTGLGLVVCRQIMQEHAGTIEMSSQLGVGTTLRLVFPLAKEAF